MTLSDLVSSWRDSAAHLERFGAEAQAKAIRECADELQTAIEDTENETLTLKDAADACGYSTRTLREMLSDGRLPNRGRKHSPAIRRGDLPRRPKARGNNSAVVSRFFEAQ